MEIHYKSIPNEEQRYPTVGDYWEENGIEEFRVSKTTEDYEFLVLIHEMVEWYITQKRGILEQDITNFDLMFEKEREQGLWKDEEPGFDPRSPYIKEHTFATEIEKKIAEELGVDWDLYDKTINEL